MNELISIVLPVYNGEQFLCESIDSVINQTYPNWELIVVDDCSSDSTPDIVKEYEKRDERIHYYRNETNLRLPRNLNRGFSLTKGDYLTWTSDDNRFRPLALEMMLRTLKENPEAQLTYASYQIIDETGKEIGLITADSNGEKHILGSNIVGACFMYTRNAYVQIGEYDPNLVLVEDFDYWQRMFMTFKTVAIKEILYDYRWHSSSLTSTKKEQQFGKTLEKMLLKNRAGFGKLDVEADYYYKRCLYSARKKQGGKNPYRWQYTLSACRQFVKCRILKSK